MDHIKAKSEFPEFADQNLRIWNANAAWWDDRIGDGNEFQTHLITPAPANGDRRVQEQGRPFHHRCVWRQRQFLWQHFTRPGPDGKLTWRRRAQPA